MESSDLSASIQSKKKKMLVPVSNWENFSTLRWWRIGSFVWSWSLISNHTKVIFIDFRPRWIEVIKHIGNFFFISSFDSPLSFTIKIRRRQKGWGKRTKLGSNWLNRLFTWNAEGRSRGVHDFLGTWEKRWEGRSEIKCTFLMILIYTVFLEGLFPSREMQLGRAQVGTNNEMRLALHSLNYFVYNGQFGVRVHNSARRCNLSGIFIGWIKFG